jgi:glutathione synthase/RimK-type ligase-like ATP-grasp enzyme
MSRRHCCFLSMDDMAHYVSDDELAIAPLEDLGWDVSTVSWSDPDANWDDYDIAVIRTTWDYQRRPEKFLDVLAKIEASVARLENPLDIVKWNLDKRYLRDVESRGVPIVPTIWDGVYDQRSFYRWMADLGTDELIIKPTISATAEHTYRLQEFEPDLADVFAERTFLVQPFVPSVVEVGEYSLFYFNGEYSHAILKAPKTDDFRVQEEHGGLITAVEPSEDLIAAGQKAFDLIGRSLLYARVDLVRAEDDELLLMELELIEPARYLRTDAGAPKRFAEAIARLMDNQA